MLIPSAIIAVCLAFTGRSEGKALKQQTWEYQPGPAWYQAPKPAPAPYPQTTFPQTNNWNNNNNLQKPSESLTNNLIPQLPNRPGEEAAFQPSIEEQRVTGDFISALKNVFNKFSTNLDHSGIHEDVSQMTSQLQQTWDELKRGLTRSWETVKTSAQDSVAPYSGQMGAHLEKLFNKAQQMVVSSD